MRISLRAGFSSRRRWLAWAAAGALSLAPFGPLSAELPPQWKEPFSARDRMTPGGGQPWGYYGTAWRPWDGSQFDANGSVVRPRMYAGPSDALTPVPESGIQYGPGDPTRFAPQTHFPQSHVPPTHAPLTHAPPSRSRPSQFSLSQPSRQPLTAPSHLQARGARGTDAPREVADSTPRRDDRPAPNSLVPNESDRPLMFAPGAPTAGGEAIDSAGYRETAPRAAWPNATPSDSTWPNRTPPRETLSRANVPRPTSPRTTRPSESWPPALRATAPRQVVRLDDAPSDDLTDESGAVTSSANSDDVWPPRGSAPRAVVRPPQDDGAAPRPRAMRRPLAADGHRATADVDVWPPRGAPPR